MCYWGFPTWGWQPTQAKQNVKSPRIPIILLTTHWQHLTQIRSEWLHQEGLILGQLPDMVASAQAACWYCHKESKIPGNHLAKLFQIVDWELRLKTVNWLAQYHMSVVDPGLEATVCLLDQTMAHFPSMQPSCQKTRQHSIHYQFRTTYWYSGYVAQWAIIL